VADMNVVIVPGLLGSQLHRVDPPNPTIGVWFNQTYLTINGPDQMHLAPNGVDPGEMNDIGPLTAGSKANVATYDVIIDRLTADGWNVIYYGYDWRKSVRQQGELLGAYLLSSEVPKPFSVLAYSMGSLLARWAYPVYRAGGFPLGWHKTVYVGCPQFGSYEAWLGLLNPFASQTWTSYLALTIAGELFRLTPSKIFRSSLSKRLRRVVASWPGLYDLLPSIAPPTWSQHTDAVPIYTADAVALKANPYIDQAQLDRAKADDFALNLLLDQPRPTEMTVLGTANDTFIALTNLAKQDSRAGYSPIFDGDGYVVSERGILPGIPNVTVTASHGQLLKVDPVVENMTKWLTVASDTITFAPQPAPVEVYRKATQPFYIPPVPFPALQRKNDP